MSKEKHIVVFTLEAIGHINPYMTIMKELKSRGHNVTLVTMNPLVLASKINDEGINTVNCSVDINKAETGERIARKHTGDRFGEFRKGPLSAFTSTYSENGILYLKVVDIEKKHDHIEATVRNLNADLILVDHLVGIPCLTKVAKKWVRAYSGFPSVLYSESSDLYAHGLGISPEDSTVELKNEVTRLKAPVLNYVKKFFEKLGYETWPSMIDLVPTSPYLNFFFGPQELSFDGSLDFKPLPSCWFRLEHTLMVEENKNDYKIPQKLVGKPGKLIYFSLGTLVNTDVVLFNRLLDILSKSPNRFIVSMGDSIHLLSQYDNIYGESYLDQKLILQNVDLFITHGGHNSLIEAFFFGVPMIVLPIFADQFDGAQRVQDCGFGYRLNAFEISECDLLSAIEKVLGNEKLALRLKGISKRLQSIRYDLIAADKLEEIMEE